MLILNGQDETDQLRAAAFWDIYLPLDAHRMLYMPGYLHREHRHLMQDHLFNLPGGLAIALNEAVFSTAVRHIFFHPSHDQTARLANMESPRMQVGKPATHPELLINYESLPAGLGIQRRWLDTHA